MRRPHLLLLALALLAPLVSLADEDTLVRVEVVVFQHVDGRSDQWPAYLGDDYGDLIDPIARAEETAAAFGSASQLSSEPGDGLGPSWPPRFVRTGSHSPTFETAVQRLQASSNYRVLTSLDWIQPLSRDVRPRPVRVRGPETLAFDTAPSPPPRLIFGQPIGASSELALPHYQLDGLVTVRQRQFRHVDLDLVWREPASISDAPGLLSPTGSSATEVLTHRLKTTRPISLDRLEYFDSPWLGALVFVQEWDRTVALESTITRSEATP